MRAWIPVPGTSQERLVRAAMTQFGAHGYQRVAVGEIAAAAGVTTGSLYHHFGNKFGLYSLIRLEIERRVIDRMRGAAAVSGSVAGLVGCAPVLLVGFDYLVDAGFARLLGEDHPTDGADEPPPDPIAAMMAEFLDAPGVPVSIAVMAAWRACLTAAVVDADSARAALTELLRPDRTT